MSFKIGLVGLCTSHPECWVPIMRELSEAGVVDVEITAAWDSGETRPAGFTGEFCRTWNIPHPVENLEDMLPLVDGVIVHTANWDRHLEQAAPFVAAGKSVYIDKPEAGNTEELALIADWIYSGHRVTGGSVMRFCREISEAVALPESERGKIYTAYTSIGVDDYNYGIHGYAELCAALGPGVVSAQYVGESNQKQIILQWSDGKCGILTVGKSAWLPFHVTITTDKKVLQVAIDNTKLYRSMLEAVLPYFTGKTDVPPLDVKTLLEPEYAALAARISWMNGGTKVYLADLPLSRDGYDGTAFARAYRQSRL